MIRYDLAAIDIEDTGVSIKLIDGKYCMTKGDVIFYDAPTKEALIEAYFNYDMSDYTYPSNSQHIKCECKQCHQEGLYFKCPGCLQTVGYCMGQDDDYYEYCTDCWYQLSQNLVTVVIQNSQTEKPNIYINPTQ